MTRVGTPPHSRPRLVSRELESRPAPYDLNPEQVDVRGEELPVGAPEVDILFAQPLQSWPLTHAPSTPTRDAD